MKTILIVSIAINCIMCNSKNVVTTNLPVCVQLRIKQIKLQPKWNPAATIYEYRYNAQTVYLVSANCCDQYTQLVDTQCKYVCAPDGGFTGTGDGRCARFYQQAERIKLVWKDDR